MYKFEIFSRFTLRGRRHFFRYRAPNGEIMFQSQAYKRRESAQETVDSIRRTAANAPVAFML